MTCKITAYDWKFHDPIASFFPSAPTLVPPGASAPARHPAVAAAPCGALLSAAAGRASAAADVPSSGHGQPGLSWKPSWYLKKTRWSPRTRMPTRMLRNKDLILICHNFQQTHLWNTLTWHTEVTLLWDTLVWHYCSGKTLLLDTLIWHSCFTLF